MLAPTAASRGVRHAVSPGQVLGIPRPVQPIWGAEYTSWVSTALTANRGRWSKTAPLVSVRREATAFFDHVTPLAAPYPDQGQQLRGKTTADATPRMAVHQGRYPLSQPALMACPRVPMWICRSKGAGQPQVFDHTRIRFLEQPSVMADISPWRRAVCGRPDLGVQLSTRTTSRS
ncbi:alkaline phosphatase family protein [Pseudomonas aeruginosa]